MIHTAIVGAGGIARKHAEALLRIPGVKVEGVLDVNRENAAAIAKLCGAPVIDSLDEVLNRIQMIHLLTPPSKRISYAGAAMRAGKHVLCEKPIASALEDGLALEKMAADNGVLFMTAFNMRHRPGYKMLQEDVLSGKLGEILSVWCHRVGPGSGFSGPLGDSWRTDPTLVCGMTVESLSHDIDMIRGLGLEIEGVSGWVRGSKPELPEFDNNAQVLLRLRGGASAVINASWASCLPMSSRGVVGTKGTACISGDGFFDFTTYRILTKDMAHEHDVRVNDPFDGESYYTENVHFLECIEKSESPLTPAGNGVAALRVGLAILESAKDGHYVKVGGAI